jgi:UDP-N-acetyl-D-glucosamine/UDP-N-acetyl-D-galactosamine dehydrogenase
MVLAGRRINDNMGNYVAGEVMRLMTLKGIRVGGARVLVLGLAFKENCPDVRNTRVVDVINELKSYGTKVDVVDPWVDAALAEHEYGIRPIKAPRRGSYDAVVAAVAHREFRELGAQGARRYARSRHVLYDIKYVFGRDDVDGRL